MWTVLIEQRDEPPKVVVFDSLVAAREFEDGFALAQGGWWDDDDSWHNYPWLVQVTTATDALSELRAELTRGQAGLDKETTR